MPPATQRSSIRFADVTTTSTRPGCGVEARTGRPVERADGGGSCGTLRAGGTLCSGGPAGPGGPAAPAGPAGPIGPTGPVAPAEPVSPAGPGGPTAPCAPAGPAGPCGPAGPRSFHVTTRSFLRQSDASLTTRRNPLPGFWQPDDHPVGLRARSRERRGAREGDRGHAGDDDCSSVHVLLPSSMSPPVVSAPGASG